MTNGGHSQHFRIRISNSLSQTHSRDLAAYPPEFCQQHLALGIRGRRECRVHAAPAVSYANGKGNARTSIQVQRRQSGIPCAMVLTVSSALSSVIGLSCHRRQRDSSHQLERQRRGVRTTRLRRPLPAPSSEAPSASTASRPAFVTIASAPLIGTGCTDSAVDLGSRSTMPIATDWHDGQIGLVRWLWSEIGWRGA